MFYIIIAGLFEVCFATFLKLSEGFTKPLYSILFVITAGLSFYLLTKGMKTIPLGTAYAVWTGIGVAGTFFTGLFMFNEPVSVLKSVFVALLVASIIGLNMVATKLPQ